MTKAKYIAEQQAKPLGEEGIKAIRLIVKNQAYAKVNECAVDLFSASAVVSVYERLNGNNQAKLRSMTVPRAISTCFKLLK